MQSWIHVIEWRANVHPQVTALTDDRGVAYTYAELRTEVERKAGGWAAAGVRPGDIIAAVDGQRTLDQDPTTISALLSGAEGSTVTLSWRGRDGRTRYRWRRGAPANPEPLVQV